jgi:hypothetical protein
MWYVDHSRQYDLSMLQKLAPPSSAISLRKRFRLFFNVVAIVALLVVAKAAIHALGFEFLKLDSLFPSIVASAVFIIGFLLSSILPDYKEAERLPGEIRVALEAIYDDVAAFARKTQGAFLEDVRATLSAVVEGLEVGLGPDGGHSDLKGAVGQVDNLSPIFARLEAHGMSQNFIVRLRSEQDNLRKHLYRISYIQKMEFIPSVHVLIQTLVIATLFLLMFLKTEGSYESSIIFAFISYMFIYALHLIAVLEQPYRNGDHSIDDVSIYLIREFGEKIRSKADAP